MSRLLSVTPPPTSPILKIRMIWLVGGRFFLLVRKIYRSGLGLGPARIRLSCILLNFYVHLPVGLYSLATYIRIRYYERFTIGELLVLRLSQRYARKRVAHDEVIKPCIKQHKNLEIEV